MTTAAILQPSYLSWPGHFYWMKNCDIFIFLDDVQYTRHDWRNRNFIKTAQGRQLLSVPIHWYGSSYYPIDEIKIANEHQWAKKHLETLRHAYSRAPYFKRYFPYFEEVFSKTWQMLSELTIITMKDLAGFLDVRPRFVISSELKIKTDNSTEKLVKLCQAVGADTYLSGKRGYDNYIDQQMFFQAGIKIVVKDYVARPYPQLWGEFISHVSVVDLLFNCGEAAKDYLKDIPARSKAGGSCVSVVKEPCTDYQVFFWKNEYDSQFFNRQIFSYSLTKDKQAQVIIFSDGFKDSKRLPQGLLIGQISELKTEAIGDALNAGFEAICRMVDLEMNIEKIPYFSSDPFIVPASPQDYRPVIEIAGKVFSVTRFHREKTMSGLADEYHRQWVKNCLEDKQADAVLVAGKSGPEGFICLSFDREQKQARIVLVGVAVEKQGRGLGAKLIEAAVNWAKERGAKKLWVRTEADNRALGFYLKNGFRQRSSALYLRKDNSVLENAKY